MGDTGGVSDPTGPVPAGWHPDPSNPNGAVRWWDGSRWTDHVQPVAPPSSWPAGPPWQTGPNGNGSAGGSQPLPPWAGRRPRGRPGGPNQASFTAIGVAALYILLAVTTHFVLIGIVPAMASIQAVRRRERLAPLAVLAAAVAIVVSITAFHH